jgi:catechol 2,3-dioxygenase-like lactoylglutathione lyase family enzyme
MARLFGITLSVPDVGAAAGFYRDVLGLALEGERHDGGPLHHHAGWGFPDDGLMFSLFPGDPAPPQELQFVVEDLDAVHERAVAHATVESPPGMNDSGAPPGWRDRTLRDPAGNTVIIYQQP